jgi:glycosyltransferase involved in cell wall biosynthesis
MKICFAQQFHLAERMGGAEVQAWLLATELARRGHHVTYIAESLGGRAGSVELRDGVHIHWLPRQLYIELPNLPAYYRALSAIAPDAVIQRSTSMYTAVAAEWARRRGKPMLWICTDDSIPFRRYFREQQALLFLRYGGSLPKRWALLAIAWLRDVAKNYGIRHASQVATQNAAQAAALRMEFDRESHRFHSGHPFPEVPPAKDVEPLILWVGDIGHHKRPELFVELADACSDLPVRFAMICKKTGGKDQLRCDALAAHGQVNPRFLWLGARSLEETNEWFARATLYVSTSAPGGDGFPNTFVQAWLRRTPVLSFGTDPDQLILRHDLGQVVNNVAEGRQAIRNFIQFAGLAAMGQRVEAYARAHHGVDSVADLALDILAQSPRAPVIARIELAVRGIAPTGAAGADGRLEDPPRAA